jgi:hypothetical protein
MREQSLSPLKRMALIMGDKYDSWKKELEKKELEKKENEDFAKTIAMLNLHQVGAFQSSINSSRLLSN